jgi:DNA modification methylase
MSEQWAVHNTVIKNINDLIEYDSNPREHTPEQVEQVANSIKEFGWTMPILIDDTNEIIAGHGRLMAGKQLGIKEVPCIIAKGWSDEQKKAYCIADNKLTENSTWSKDFLKLNLTNLYDNEFDLKLTGFSDDELSKILPDFNIDEGLTDEDDVPTPPEEPVTKLGDIWLCGEHRVMCGDSTSDNDTDRLINNAKIDLVFTDAPYGINVVQSNQVGGEGITESGTYSKILGDETIDTAQKFYELCLKKNFKDFILWGGNYFTNFLKPSRCWIIWDKEMTGNFSQAEMAWTSFEKGGVKIIKHLWNGLSREGNRKEELKSRVHPTQKPVGLFFKILQDYKNVKTIYDGFLGSGSTLIACEKSKKICYGLELDSKYCDVIVKRWQNYTGQEAVLESDGTKFNDMLK